MVFENDYKPTVFTLGILRDHGLTEMLLTSGMEKELSKMILSRAQWLSEHYVCEYHPSLDTLFSRAQYV